MTIDTQSDPHSKNFSQYGKQFTLSRLLAKELVQAMGIADAEVDNYGYACTLPSPSNSEKEALQDLLCSHVDTAPDCTERA